jgi:hypothetical protein
VGGTPDQGFGVDRMLLTSTPRVYLFPRKGLWEPENEPMKPHTAATERHNRALELHLGGATYAAIAGLLGYASKSGARKAVQTALGDRRDLSDAVRTELARMDAMLTGLWAKARRGDLQSVDRVLKISERRTYLLLSLPADEPVPAVTALDQLRARRAAGKRPVIGDPA